MAPFLLAPASPSHPDPRPALLEAIIQGYTALDTPRRLTGSFHAQGKGARGLGVLVSTYCKGGWKKSPWGVREQLGEVQGIPRDMDEWEALRAGRDLVMGERAGTKLETRNGNGGGKGKGKGKMEEAGRSSSSGELKMVNLVKASKGVNTVFKSSKPSLATSNKPRSSTSSRPPPPRDPPRGSFKAGMHGGDFSSQPIPPVPPKGKERAVDVEEDTVEESFWSHDHTLGRGKDEEVLFSQGCTQMIMEPTTVLPFTSPLPTHYLHIPLLPTFTPRLTATSTPLKDLARSRTEPDLELTSRNTDPKIRRTNTMSDLHSQPILRAPSSPVSVKTKHLMDPSIDPLRDPLLRSSSVPAPPTPAKPTLPPGTPPKTTTATRTPEKMTPIKLTSILNSSGSAGKREKEEMEVQMESIGGFLGLEMQDG